MQDKKCGAQFDVALALCKAQWVWLGVNGTNRSVSGYIVFGISFIYHVEQK